MMAAKPDPKPGSGYQKHGLTTMKQARKILGARVVDRQSALGKAQIKIAMWLDRGAWAAGRQRNGGAVLQDQSRSPPPSSESKPSNRPA